MLGKPKAKPKKSSDPEQHKRFVETARKLGADESPEAFDQAFKKVTGRPQKSATPERRGRNR
jgi:hypothetical protein